MKDKDKTKKQLISELEELRKYRDQLEELVEERTEELIETNKELQQEIAERKRVEEALRESEKRYMELSITDDLTKLYNARHFYNQLKSEIERAVRYNHPLSLLLLDIDDFKRYNNKYGHLEGDKVLVKFNEIFQRCLRKADSAYRYGGEEFTVILPETKGEEALNVAERIRKEFEAEIFSPTLEDTVHMTVNIGVAQYLPDEKLSAFLERVERGMYLAKEQGRNRTFFLE